MNTYSDRLRALAKSHGMKQSDLAKKTGVSFQSISAYMRGREMPYSRLCQIADLFGTSVDYLLGHETENDILVHEIRKDAYLRGVSDVIHLVQQYQDTKTRVSLE